MTQLMMTSAATFSTSLPYLRLARRLTAIASIGLGALLGTVGLSACGGESGTSSGGAQTGGTSGTAPKNGAQDFTAQDVNGKSVHLSDYLGKQVILINFWGTFCEPCLAEFPHIRRMYADNKAKGFIVLAVSMDGPDTIANVPAFVKRNQLDFPVLLDEDSHVAAIYNPKKSAPLSILIDRSGRIVRTHEGYNPGDEVDMLREVEKALAEPAAPAR
jgi:peroxiredoxin